MYQSKIILFMAFIFALTSCNSGSNNTETESGNIGEETVEAVISEISNEISTLDTEIIQKGVAQVAALWTSEDGDADAFSSFCKENIAKDAREREDLFNSLSRNYEKIWGHSNQVSLEVNKPLHLAWGDLNPVDLMFAAYSPGAHFYEDFFQNKIAFVTILNFPFYSLQEKNEMGENWSRLEYAYARMGDVFTARVPAYVNKEITEVATLSDNYISEYNIAMDRLVDENGRSFFPPDMKLISHWGLRDEIKSQYANADGLEKQEMIYRVMLRIINQDIPEMVINNNEVSWNPYTNEVMEDGKVVEAPNEPMTRYNHLLENFKAHKKADKYSPNYPTYIERAFNQGLELSSDEVAELFKELVGSPVMIEVADLIRTRLGRELQPFDIWYDGFKARSNISEDLLSEKTTSLYADAAGFEKGIPDLLLKLGYDQQRAEYLASKIVVDPARGAGHAWGAQMRSQMSHLRTRIPEDGMDYKGYNIAIHELGHNVEQTITLYDMDHYLLSGVPNTAFTEAMAFMYQSRDLDLLGMSPNDPNTAHLKVLDNIWGAYEIMGVSLVDIQVWEWMYANPEATPEKLKDQVVKIATEVWNEYYAPVFGIEDQPILGIYSHMISYPLYLSAYPLGQLIEFQVEQYIEGKNFADETDRIFKAGKITPQHWMKNAVNQEITAQPLISRAQEAVNQLK